MVKSGKFKVIHNAINLDDFIYSGKAREKIRQEHHWNGKFVIGHAGRFTEQKNHRFIIDIFAAVHKKFPDSILVFAGDGHLMDTVKQQVHELGLDDAVQFLGTRFDVNQLMQGMDVFLFPSLYEGLGNVITEAQAVGLQCVVADTVPSEVKFTEYVEYLSLKASAEAWAEVIEKYHDGYVRRDTHAELISAGYEIRTAARDLKEYYKGLVN